MKSVLFFGLAIFLAGEETRTRGIVPEDVVKARPALKSASAGPKAAYRRVPGRSSDESSAGRQIGVTIWRLRAANAGDTGARILTHSARPDEGWIPERAPSTASLRAGDLVRLTVESPEPGYLYVIDRERYASGETGEPYLIFPTTKTRNGDNKLLAGKLIDIPGQADQPNFFRLARSRPDQAHEELTLLVTPAPLPEVTIGASAAVLPKDLVAKWEKTWGRESETFELAGSAGKAWTLAERNAAADGTRLLTHDDPAPQTVYRVGAKPGEPILVKVTLRYAADGR